MTKIKEDFRVEYYEIDGLQYLRHAEIDDYQADMEASNPSYHIFDLGEHELEGKYSQICQQLRAWGFSSEDNIRIYIAW